jgi:hypothetical protein
MNSRTGTRLVGLLLLLAVAATVLFIGGVAADVGLPAIVIVSGAESSTKTCNCIAAGSRRGRRLSMLLFGRWARIVLTAFRNLALEFLYLLDDQARKLPIHLAGGGLVAFQLGGRASKSPLADVVNWHARKLPIHLVARSASWQSEGIRASVWL